MPDILIGTTSGTGSYVEGSGTTKLTVATTAPSSPAVGDVWIDSDATSTLEHTHSGAYGSLYDPLGFGMALNMFPRVPAAAAWDTANRGYYWRVINGCAAARKVHFQVGTQSGNISFALWRNTGVGPAGRPGTLLVASGAVACPASGEATVDLGTTVDLLPGDWIGMSCDNTTATFHADGVGFAQANSQAGQGGYLTAAHPLAGSSPTFTQNGFPRAAYLTVQPT